MFRLCLPHLERLTVESPAVSRVSFSLLAVALVATAPAQRRRGYAEAVMRRALEVAASTHGDCPTVLHATDAGRPIYARMGYAPISTHTLFMDAALLSAH